MLSIAIVEDDAKALGVLKSHISAYMKDFPQDFRVFCYQDGHSFLNDAQLGFDIVFMDIELPTLNGMDAARRFRESDMNAVIIFVTNMAQYAIKGYEVNALDYVLKPISYQNFVFKFAKAIKIANSKESFEISIAQAKTMIRILAKDLMYVEVSDHKLIYHTISHPIVAYGSLSELEERLKPAHFIRSNHCFLVNPKYIFMIHGNELHLKNGEHLQISRPRKKAVMIHFANWLGEGNTL